ncbi:PepSY domain-containing protein [Novosphingobium umbonatum]|uniref:PepSY domain-containing protein n=1 Tax=Novosphingobium umbonatum TaxID=1908524 RepID=A0A437MX71_9SPHN|nr:PepSY-associated TM helix domain-containing protein [Novosphingobium umbonatum]RVU02264.1 PepSY domain-containing protein [Novosphingobium umbonatum]
MVKPFFIQFHRWLGLILAVILGLMALTGAMLSYEDEIAHAFYPSLYAPGASRQADLTPDQLVAKVEAAHPAYYVDRLEWPVDRAASVTVRLAPAGKGAKLEGQAHRATGQWLGAAPSAPFFATVRRLHRWLLLPGNGEGWGRDITGAAAIGLVVLAFTGLYLRWPYRALRWREWLVVDWRRKKRLFWRSLHVVVATWAIPFWLLSAATGLWWSYQPYREVATQVLTGKPASSAKEKAAKPVDLEHRPALDPVWRVFLQDHGQAYGLLRVALPEGKADKLVVEALASAAAHDRALDRFTYDPVSARLIKADYYARRSLGVAITQSMLELHRGAMLGRGGRAIMLLSTLILALACVSGLIMFAYRQFKIGRKEHRSW